MAGAAALGTLVLALATSLPRTSDAPALRAARPHPTLPGGISRGGTHAWHSHCDRPLLTPASYGYPIRPFDRQHPIRGFFGDPRTNPLLAAPPGPGEPGSFAFHNGIDIVAATGTPVYPVVSGTAEIGYGDEVIVRTHRGMIFQYFHIRPLVREGEEVKAFTTVLGRVEPHYLHVHMSEIDAGRVHNPLDPGHLEPYHDYTLPAVQGLRFVAPDGRRLDPRRLTGPVAVSAAVDDRPTLEIAAERRGYAIMPALVRWRLTTARGRVAIPARIAVDFRRTEPPNGAFWTVYGGGTRQNEYPGRIGRRVGSPGRYLVRLTRTPLDTRRLRDGRYVLAVEAADTCGNRGWLRESVTIANGPP